MNAGEDVAVNSDECGTTCTGVEAEVGDTSAGKAILKGEIESILEECSSCVTPGEKLCEACDILSCAFYGEIGIATGAKETICEDVEEDGDESFNGAN